MSDKPGPEEGRIFTGRFSHVGSTGYGTFVQFVAGFENSPTETFRCRYENMPQLLQGLQSAAAIVEQARAGVPQPSLDLAAPHRATNARVGQAPDGTIAIQVSTEKGIPVVVAMSRSIAATLSQALAEELRRTPPKLS